MSRLTFRRLRIGRFLAIDQGFEIDELATGVNIVFGPNASGKTTTARALEALVWPREAAPRGAIVDATAELGDDRWSIRIDSGYVEQQRNGSPDSLPTAPAEGRDRYRLWLPDLLSQDDSDFARRILIESSGGYDLEAGGKALGARRPSMRAGEEQKRFRAAREKVNQARAEEAKLRQDAEALAGMEERLARRPALMARHRQIDLAIRYIEAEEQAAEARAVVDGFPGILARLSGDEAERIQALQKRLNEARQKQAEARTGLERAKRRLERIDLPERVVAGPDLDLLRKDAARLQELARDLAEQERAVERATERLRETSAALGDEGGDREKLSGLDLTGLESLEAAIEAVEQNRSERRALESELRTLPNEPPPLDLDRTRNGAFLLQQWLASAPKDDELERFRFLALAGAGLLLVAGLGYFILGAITPGMLAILVAAALGAVVYRVPVTGDARAAHESDFIALGLPDRPAEWEPTAVRACLDRITAKESEGRHRSRQWDRRQDITAKLEELKKQQREFDERLHEVADRFGLQLPEDAVRFSWLIQRISEWQRARLEQAGLKAAYVKTFAQHQEVLEAANSRLLGIGLREVGDPRALAAVTEKLEKDVREYEQAAGDLEREQSAVERAGAEIESFEAEIATILRRLEITEDEVHALPEWCATVDAFRKSREQASITEAERDRLKARIESDPGFEMDWLAMARETLREEVLRIEEEVSRLDELAQEIGSLRERMRAARNTHALEDALAELDVARQAVLDQRKRELRAAIANVVVEYVEGETRNEHLPRVFHRANEIFLRVTRHAFRLHIDPGNPPSFRAIDTRTGRGFALDELSSGTRLQLLLSVRIAFVEAFEAGVALPVLMDETLANSDDERAAAIMDAIVEIAASGRQVFYFTAQPDEVAKWQAVLKARSDLEWKLIDLAAARGAEHRLDPSAFTRPERSAARIEIPSGVAHDAVPEHIQVPGIRSEEVGELHLWYLIEDVETLRYVLNDLHFFRWGELRSLFESGGGGILEDDVRQTLLIFAEAAEAALEGFSIGRGRSVDRQALLDSGVVSDVFIDRVTALAERVDGDARRILEELDNKAVRGFLQKNKDGLRDYFEEQGYLDHRPRLNLEEVRQRMVTRTAEDLRSGRIQVRSLHRLLVRLAVGANFVEAARPREETQSTLPLPDLETDGRGGESLQH